MLDLSPIVLGENPAHSLRNTLNLARHVENLGIIVFGWLNIIIYPLSLVPLHR